jgi:predicted GH43/DUF377 family glycosyl hydrolase
MITYQVEQIRRVTLIRRFRPPRTDLMSPYVWRENGRYCMLARRVPKPRPGSFSGLIYSAASEDGLNFKMDDKPAIRPGPDEFDAGGCEDPTVQLSPDGGYLVFYTGLDAAHRQGSLLIAEGPDMRRLKKQRLMLKAPEGEGNIKEATLTRAAGGDWRLFYEYAKGEASRIGMASGPTPQGPWTVIEDPFGIRPKSWDNWHLSTGPIASVKGQDPVMFYNGATHDARWRIGWITFDPDYKRVTGRGIEPLVVPPPADNRTDTDIAFAASCIVEHGAISLYYSVEDRMLRRAQVVRFAGKGRA